MQNNTPDQNIYFKSFILAGLIFGLIGDIVIFFSDYDQLWFLLGMGAFLIGHIMYVLAFINGCSPTWDVLVTLAIVCVVFAGLMIYLQFDMGDLIMWIGVIFYCVVIAVMYSLAFEAPRPDLSSYILVIGTTLFVLSDFVLAWGKFAKRCKPIACVSNIGAVCYFVGQGLIAFSIFFYHLGSRV